MTTDFKGFVKFVKTEYVERHKVQIIFPSFDEMTSYHQEFIMRSKIEAKYFDIEDDIDSLIVLSHIDLLGRKWLLPRISELDKMYKEHIFNCIKIYK